MIFEIIVIAKRLEGHHCGAKCACVGYINLACAFYIPLLQKCGGKHMTKRFLAISYIFQNQKSVPLIRLQGRWLQELGFTIGSKVKIEVKNGMLLIKPV